MSTHLADVERRIRCACDRAGRDRSSVTLVGASKRQPIQRLESAVASGLLCFGENRVQEAEEKIPLLSKDIDWHLIGPLQSNKAARAAALFSTVHSIDRVKIARALDRHAGSQGRTLVGFLQVNLGDEATKSGFAPAELVRPDTIQTLLNLEHLQIGGLMAIPPPTQKESRARYWFQQLRALSQDLRDANPIGPNLSMGMSSDFEIAIEEGATHVRVGSSLFGQRPD